MADAVTYEVPSNGSHNKVIYYAQGNTGGGSAWAAKKFGGQDIANSGCSVTSLAMVLTYWKNQGITPDQVVDKIAAAHNGDYNYHYDKVKGSGQNHTIFADVAKIYGLTCHEIADWTQPCPANVQQEITKYLNQGYPVIQSCSKGTFTGGGHFIVLTGTYSNFVRVNDPSHPVMSYNDMTLEQVVNSNGNGKGWWVVYDPSQPSPGKYSFDGHPYTGGSVQTNGSSVIENGALAGNAVSSSSSGSSGIGSAIASVASAVSSVFSDGVDAAKKLLSGIFGYKVMTYQIAYETVTEEIERDEIVSIADEDYTYSSAATSLLSYPTLVESPFVSLKVGDYTFGVSTQINSDNTVDFPNYITGMTVTKISGQVNQYTINLTYQISDGDDPNLVDKIFSTVGYGKVYISYGDWNAPTFIYKEEEAIITKLTSNVNFRSSSIEYTLNCTSCALALAASYFTFPEITTQPSSLIQTLMNDTQYGLSEMFPGNSQMNVGDWLQLDVADQSVTIPEQKSMDPLSYLNLLVTYMCPAGDDPKSALKSGNYYMSIHDDSYGQVFNGTYFTIQYVPADGSSVAQQSGVFEVDIGYPTDNLVTEFKIKNDSSWALLYNYNTGGISQTAIDNANAEANAEITVDTSGITNTITEGVTENVENALKVAASAVTIKSIINPLGTVAAVAEAVVDSVENTIDVIESVQDYEEQKTAAEAQKAAAQAKADEYNEIVNSEDVPLVNTYTYTIDSDGRTKANYSPAAATSLSRNKMTAKQKSWWTQMTQFPISAELQMKGLVRPSMLMQYLKVNAVFFGQRHVSSGLYVITKEVDTVGSQGYKTTLTLQRVAGDSDYIQSVKTQVTSTIPTSVSVTSTSVDSYNVGDFFDNVLNAVSELDIFGNAKDDTGNAQDTVYGGAATASGSQGTTTLTSTISSSATADPSEVAEAVWKAFKKLGCTDEGAAGAMGSLYAESGMIPNSLENLCREQIVKYGGPKYTDVEYTNAVNNGTISRAEFLVPLLNLGNPPSKLYSNGRHYGYGLCQWTTDARKGALYDMTVPKGISIGDPAAQVSYIMYELQTQSSYNSVFQTLKTSHDINETCYTFYKVFEGPPDTDTSYPKRLENAQKYYNTYKGTT